jgi:hypothetical protein
MDCIAASPRSREALASFLRRVGNQAGGAALRQRQAKERPVVNASEFAESTRVHVAGEVMYNLNWVNHHLTELERLLKDETLSDNAWHSLWSYSARIERLVAKTRPRLPMANEVIG